MSRRVPRAEAQATLEALTLGYFGGSRARAALARPEVMARAIAKAEDALPNRATRRALGARGDGRLHPLATRHDVVRTRNAR